MNDQVEEAGRAALRSGRVLGGLLCLLFVGIGLVTGTFILREAWLDLAPHFWKPVECRILESAVRERRGGPDAPYAIAIRYEYRWANRSLVSDRIFRRPRTFADHQEAQRLLDRYPMETRAICRVNPARPEEAVLEKRFPWMVLGLMVPIGFVVAGALGCRGAFWGRAPGEGLSADSAPLSSRAGGTRLPAGCLFVFFLLFFGAGTFVLLFIRPAMQSLWMALIPGAFMAAGAGGMLFALRHRSGANGAWSSRGRVGRVRPIEPIDAGRDSGPVVLRSTAGRLGKFVGFLVFGGIWNGVVAAFLVPFARGTRQISVDWSMALFLIPFVLVGLVVIGLVVYHFLALFAPRVNLTLAHRDLRLGESVDVTWAFAGRVRRIEKLRLYLEGCEEATYRRGTSTATDRSVFAEAEIVTTTDPVTIGGGQATLTVPADAVPTLAGSNNKIVWTLRVKGVIRMYPDVDDTFEIPVLPRASGGRG